MRTVSHVPTRKYIKVTSDFDATGYMQPKAIVWEDGRIFPIEKVKDFRPSSSTESGREYDCYTIVVKGEEKHLFFERLSPLFTSRIGRWFVEIPTP